MIVTLVPRERACILSQRHNTDGIPAEYYNVPRERLYVLSDKNNKRLEEEFDEFLTEDEVLAYVKETIEPY